MPKSYNERGSPERVLKWLDYGVIYPIFNSSWVSPVQVVPKKWGTIEVKNENNERLPTRRITSWRICIDFRKLNKMIKKDNFLLPFINQNLDIIAGNEYFCFLDGYSMYNQIVIASNIKRRPHSLALTVPSPLRECHLAYVMHPGISKDA